MVLREQAMWVCGLVLIGLVAVTGAGTTQKGFLPSHDCDVCEARSTAVWQALCWQETPRSNGMRRLRDGQRDRARQTGTDATWVVLIGHLLF